LAAAFGFASALAGVFFAGAFFAAGFFAVLAFEALLSAVFDVAFAAVPEPLVAVSFGFDLAAGFLAAGFLAGFFCVSFFSSAIA
jgi:hypothetical protein